MIKIQVCTNNQAIVNEQPLLVRHSVRLWRPHVGTRECLFSKEYWKSEAHIAKGILAMSIENTHTGVPQLQVVSPNC